MNLYLFYRKIVYTAASAKDVINYYVCSLYILHSHIVTYISRVLRIFQLDKIKVQMLGSNYFRGILGKGFHSNLNYVADFKIESCNCWRKKNRLIISFYVTIFALKYVLRLKMVISDNSSLLNSLTWERNPASDKPHNRINIVSIYWRKYNYYCLICMYFNFDGLYKTNLEPTRTRSSEIVFDVIQMKKCVFRSPKIHFSSVFHVICFFRML